MRTDDHELIGVLAAFEFVYEPIVALVRRERRMHCRVLSVSSRTMTLIGRSAFG